MKKTKSRLKKEKNWRKSESREIFESWIKGKIGKKKEIENGCEKEVERKKKEEKSRKKR